MTALWLLVLKHWKPVAVIAVLILLALAGRQAWARHDAALIEQGRLLERVAHADSAVRVTDTVLVHDTVRVARAVAALPALRDSILVAVHDTNWVHDTALVIRYVAKTDTAVAACTELLHDCAAFRASATAEIAALRAEKQVTIYHATWTQDARAGLVGALLGEGLRVALTRKF